MAPEIYAVDYRAKRIFMQGIEHKLVDTAKARNPPALTRNEEIQIVDMYQKMIIDDIPVGVEPEGMGLNTDGTLLVNT